MVLRRLFLGLFSLGVALMLQRPAMGADGPNVSRQVITIKAADGVVEPALMTFPSTGMNVAMPAIIHIQGGPGGSPFAGSGPWIASELAEHGYTTIAPLARHGSDLHTYTFEQVDADIKATIDLLEQLGFRDIILTGSSWGSICTTRYLVDTQDPRVKANIHFAPTADPNA